MKLYICGNGFDLHHDMKTSYFDYKRFLENSYKGLLDSFEEYCGHTDVNILWSRLEDNMNFDISYELDSIMDYTYPSAVQDGDSKWDDFDNEIDNQLGHLTDFSGKCFVEWLETISYKGVKISEKIFPTQNDYYITFNYTHTLEKIYCIPDSNILHIHGSVDELNKSLNKTQAKSLSSHLIKSIIQFGNIDVDTAEIKKKLFGSYGNDEMYEASICRGIDRYVEIMGTFAKDISLNYNRLSNFLDKVGKIDEVIVAGHSLGEMDMGYYDKILIPRYSDTKWTIMIHTEKDEEILAELKEKLNKIMINGMRW